MVADLSKTGDISPAQLQAIGYTYEEALDKWNISDAAADYIYHTNGELPFGLPGTLKVLIPANQWVACPDKEKYFPLFQFHEFVKANEKKCGCQFCNG